MNHDYTKEIKECVDFIIGKMKETNAGSQEEIQKIVLQAIDKYGFAIAKNAERAITKACEGF